VQRKHVVSQQPLLMSCRGRSWDDVPGCGLDPLGSLSDGMKEGHLQRVPPGCRCTLCVGQDGGWLAVAIPRREALVAYRLVRAATLRRPPEVAPAIAERLEAHARALDLLVEVVRALLEDDERLLMLGTLLVRGGSLHPARAATTR
jgi:hypothetical protein